MKNKAIAFDLDGTLIDVSLRDYTIYKNVVNKLNGNPIDYSNYWSLRRNKTDIHYILSQSGIKIETEVEQFLQQRKALMEDTEYLKLDTLFPSTPSILNNLNSEYDIYIISIRSNKKSTAEQLHSFGLDGYKSYIVNEGKIEYMRKIQNLVAMVGDTENDILPANELRIKSVAVLSGIRNRQQLELLNPDCIINSISEINRVLER